MQFTYNVIMFQHLQGHKQGGERLGDVPHCQSEWGHIFPPGSSQFKPSPLTATDCRQHSQTPEGPCENISQKKLKHLSVGGWDFCVFGNIAFNFIFVWHNKKIVHNMYYVMYYVMKILPRYENFDRFKNMSGYEICQDIKILSRCYGCGRIKKLYFRRLIEHY